MRIFKQSLLALCLIAFTGAYCQNPVIPSNVFGMNMWMWDHYITGTQTYPGGSVNSNKNIQSMVDNLSANIIRVGGADIDVNGTSISTTTLTNDYARFIQQVKYRNPNAKFIIQIPYASNNYGFTTTNCQTLINGLAAVFGNNPGFYYAIGNEWDAYSSTQKTVSNVATQFMAFAKKIKETDTNAIVLSPNFKSFYSNDGTYTYYQELFNPSSLNYIGGYIPSGVAAGKPYCDIIDLHTYPSQVSGTNSGLYTLSSTNYAATRTAMENHPQGKFANELANNTSSGFNGLQLLINNCSRGTGSAHPLKIAYTEINVTYQNPTLSSQSSTSIYENTFDGIATRSFFGGQWMMEMFCSFLLNSSDKAAFMLPWSVHESGGDGMYTSPGVDEDLSFTRGTANNSTEPTPVSLYYHYEMLADNLRNCTNVLKGTVSTGCAVKAFGGYNTLTGANAKFVVFLINQSSNAYTGLTIQLDNSTPSGTSAKMNFPGAPNVGYSYNMAANSTAVLVFNYGGELIRKVEYSYSNGTNGTPTYTHYSPTSSNYIVMTELGPDQTVCCGGITLQASPVISGALYSWYKSSDDFAAVIGTNSSYVVPVNTSYLYKCVVTYNGQTAWDYVKASLQGGTQSCCKPMGIAEISNDESDFTAMPNPTADMVTIKYTLPENINSAKINITDISGKLIKSLTVTKEAEATTLDCKNLASGVYFYSLSVNGNILKTKKLVVTK